MQSAIQPVYGSNVIGFLVLGLNARRPFNDAYRDYIRLLNDRINACTAHIVLPKEQREAQAATEEAALRHASLTKQLLLRTQEAERGEANFMRIGTSYVAANVEIANQKTLITVRQCTIWHVFAQARWNPSLPQCCFL